MYIQYVSDVHLESYRFDGWTSILDNIIENGTSCDMLILAGDFCEVLGWEDRFESAIEYLSLHYRGILHVPGNHEYYGSDWTTVNNELMRLTNKHEKFVSLRNEMVEVEGIKFYGGTLWYDYYFDNHIYRNLMNDDNQILNLEGKDYQAYLDFKNNFEKYIELFGVPDIVISHHLPSLDCIPERFVGFETNRFYVGDCMELIQAYNPQYWIHGHTHESLDFYIKMTKILCNPAGYSSDRNLNFDPSRYILI